MTEIQCDMFFYSLSRGGSKCLEPATYTLRRKEAVEHYCKHHYDMMRELNEKTDGK